MANVAIITGPAIVGHLFRDEAEAIEKALPVLVHHYATAIGMDVHHAEASLVEVRGINRRTGERAAVTTTEVRIGGLTIASWREVAERPASDYTSDTAQNSGPWARRSRG